MPPPTGHRAAVETARPPQSTAPAFVSAMFKSSTTARRGAYGAQAHSSAPHFSAQAHVHSQRASPVPHGLPARARAISLRQWARARCAFCRLLSRAHRSRRPRKSAALRCASSGRGLFGRGAPCWRTLRAAPSRFARQGASRPQRGRRCGFAAIGARAPRALSARCARAHPLRTTAPRGGLWPADGQPVQPLGAVSCCPPMAGSAGPLPAPHRLTNGSADALH